MSAQRLRDAATAERQEWGDEVCRRTYPTASAIHLALADWLDDLAAGWPWDGIDEELVVDPDGCPLKFSESMDIHALRLANLILGGTS